MTLDFDPFWMFKIIGDPLLLIGDPVGDPRGGHQKKNMTLSTYRMGLIQSALVKAMSGAAQKIFFIKFGCFLTFLHNFEVKVFDKNSHRMIEYSEA